MATTGTLSLAAEGGKDRYGHHSYVVAEEKSLVSVGHYRKSGRVVKLNREAAAMFKKMMTTAHKEGARIIPISGFRSIDYQRGLFDRATKKHGSEENAARWVAPPGHSEHHMGLALDLGDESAPSADVDQSFEGTASFRWLELNADRFGFAISFPKNNPQGVSYEPWHWHYFGRRKALRKTKNK